MGTWLWAIFLLNGQKAAGCGWMFRRVPVTGLTGQIFGCFLDYNDWTSAGEGVGAHVHSPCVYVGFATMPSGFPASWGAAGCSGLLRRARAGCASRFSRREMLRAAAAAAAGSALPLPAPGGFALAAGVCLKRLHPTGEKAGVEFIAVPRFCACSAADGLGCGPAAHKSGRENVANTIQIFA